jgi:hypothetical protein
LLSFRIRELLQHPYWSIRSHVVLYTADRAPLNSFMRGSGWCLRWGSVRIVSGTYNIRTHKITFKYLTPQIASRSANILAPGCGQMATFSLRDAVFILAALYVNYRPTCVPLMFSSEN